MSGLAGSAAMEAVQKSVVVNASAERAFQVFTDMGTWWPLVSHHIGKVAAQTAVIEPRVGGRWYERGEDGSECNWGKVLAWDPPHRLVLAWQISAEWQYDAGFETEVEVRFVPDGAGKTRVELEHRKLEAFGEKMAAVRASIGGEGGWQGILQKFADVVNAQ